MQPPPYPSASVYVWWVTRSLNLKKKTLSSSWLSSHSLFGIKKKCCEKSNTKIWSLKLLPSMKAREFCRLFLHCLSQIEASMCSAIYCVRKVILRTAWNFMPRILNFFHKNEWLELVCSDEFMMNFKLRLFGAQLIIRQRVWLTVIDWQPLKPNLRKNSSYAAVVYLTMKMLSKFTITALKASTA